jgi:protease PrsW
MTVIRRLSALIWLLSGLVLYAAIRQATLDTRNPKLAPSLLLMGAAVVPVAFVLFVGGRRLRFGVGAATVALTAVVGGVVGTVTASVLEFDTRRDLGVLPVFSVGLIEEAAKLAAPLVVLLLVRPRHPADGMLVGVASGAGFAVLETMGFGLVILLQSGGDIALLDRVLAERAVSSPLAHMAWTGLAAAALWYAAAHWQRPRAWGWLIGTYLTVAALHALWDATESNVVRAVLGAVALAALLVVFRLLAADDRRQSTPSSRIPQAVGPTR